MNENDTMSSGPGPQPTVDRDPWDALRGMTDARIALGRCGAAPPIAAVLDFRLAYARARDAVHSPFRSKELADALSRMHPCLLLDSRAPDRHSYLSRPDWGRQLSDSSLQVLDQQKV
ncbi:MAG: ethanolamine ammonia-lyase light chain EutC, partial [Opitutales bacterium]|nr:ethanolamine ammonia-lyase light chain EutC [Opitutales bacterium]